MSTKLIYKIQLNNFKKIIIFLTLIIILLFINSCTIIQPYKVIKEIEFYLHIFENEAAIRGFNYNLHKNIIIEFGDISSGASTLKSRPGTIKIIINSKNWNNYLNDIGKEILIMHELGHGAIMRSYHNNFQDCDGFPISIMNNESWINSIAKNYKLHREEMLNELFGVNSILEKCKR